MSSINLFTDDVTDFTPTQTPDNITYCLCNRCYSSYILSTNPYEFIITPRHAESEKISGFNTIDCFQLKFKRSIKEKTCTFQEKIQLIANEFNLQSNIGTTMNGKAVHFRGDKLVLAGNELSNEKILEIVEESDLKEVTHAGFYSNANGLYCLDFKNIDHSKFKVDLYVVNIDNAKFQAKFIHKIELPNFPTSFDPRSHTFFIDSRMLVWQFQNYIFTYVFGMVSLTEGSYVSLSNSFSDLHRTYQKTNNLKRRFGDSKHDSDDQTLGYSQNDIKRALKIPSSFKLVNELV